jgi:hypothetical protein
MRIVKIVALALIGLIVLVFLVGALLPESYEGEVKLVIRRTPEEIWATTQDFQRHPIGGAMTKGVERQPDENGLPVWLEDFGGFRLRVQVVAAQAPNRWKFRVTDQEVRITSESDSHIEAVEGGARIRTNYRVSLPLRSWHAPIYRIVFSTTSGSKQGIRDYWSNVARTLGETPQFEE